MKIINILSNISVYISSKIQKKLNTVLIIILLIFCLGNLLLTPPFQVADESSHFLKAYQISEGKLLGIKKDSSVSSIKISGDYLPNIIKTDISLFDDLIFTYKKISRQEFLQRLMKSKNLTTENLRNKEFIGFSNTVIYPPIPYLPQAAGLVMSRLLRLNTIQAIYLARLFTLIASLSLIYYALRQINFSLKIRLVIFFLLGLPTTAFQLASTSADSITIALSVAVVAMALKLKQSWQSRDFFIFLFISSCLSLCKFPYFMISWMVFPSILNISDSWKNKIKIILLVLLCSVVISLTWQMLASQVVVKVIPGHTDTKTKLLFFLSHPLKVSFVFLENLLKNSFYLGGITGRMGWNIIVDSKIRSGYIFLIFISVLIGYKKENNYEKNNLIYLITNIVLFLSMIYIILLMLYLFWINTVISLNGVQGRYFIPPLILFLISIPSLYHLRKYEGFYIISILTLWLILSYNVLLGLYYRFWI